MSPLSCLGVVLVLALIAGVGALSGRKVKSAADFDSGGGKAGSWIVAGTIMGTLVSGQSTVGTAQLAFTFGMSAWWFTLGAGIGCLVLALGYAAPLRRSGSATLVGVLSAEYGPAAGYLASILNSVGTFISVIAQIVAATALLSTIFPIGAAPAALISVALMAVYVVFGGVWGAGMGGVAKLILLYGVSVAGGVLALMFSGGAGALLDSLGALLGGTPLGLTGGLESAAAVTGRYTSLISRGAMKDIGSGVSLILGVLSTQTYSQAIWSAKSDAAAKKGALLSALLIPPIGIASILIGLFMRTQCVTAAEAQALAAAGQAIPAGLFEIAGTAQVFPAFIVHYMPKLLGGVALGTLLITVVGGGAGLSLGVATILVNDIARKCSKGLEEAGRRLFATRSAIVAVLLVGMAVTLWVEDSLINDLGFLSMGLRAAVVFVPLCCCLWLKGRIAPKWAKLSILLGPAGVVAGKLLGLPFDSLFLSILLCALTMLLGLLFSRRTTDQGGDL